MSNQKEGFGDLLLQNGALFFVKKREVSLSIELFKRRLAMQSISETRRTTALEALASIQNYVRNVACERAIRTYNFDDNCCCGPFELQNYNDDRVYKADFLAEWLVFSKVFLRVDHEKDGFATESLAKLEQSACPCWVPRQAWRNFFCKLFCCGWCCMGCCCDECHFAQARGGCDRCAYYDKQSLEQFLVVVRGLVSDPFRWTTGEFVWALPLPPQSTLGEEVEGLMAK